MSRDDALNELRQLLGPKGFTSDAEVMAPWLTDQRGRYHGTAAAMLSPANQQEVAQIVTIAAKHNIPLVPQGGNSGMVAGATPDSSGNQLLLSLRRMDHIGAVDEGTGLAQCEAGVVLQNLHEAVATSGRRFPLTLGGKGSATVGGLISTNAGGTQVLRHGTMRSLVAGISAVLPDGSIFDGLAALKKDNRGYDLKHLLIGAEGTLGVVTGATLVTIPALIDRCVAWVGVDSPEAAYKLLQLMQQGAGPQLEGFELMPQSAVNAVVRHIAGTRWPTESQHDWNVLMELVQDQPSQRAPAELAAALLQRAIELGLADDAVLASNEAQAEGFWKIRDSISEAERAEGPAMQHDISVPVSEMARFIASESPAIERAFPGTKVVAFGHLGDGNIHYHVKAPPGADPATWYQHEGQVISASVYDRVAAYGGSLSAEHGIGQSKIGELSRLGDTARLNAQRAIKAALDPQGIMNPGKLVPLASDSSDH